MPFFFSTTLPAHRAIGDTIGHQIGIISEPDFMEININEDEDILVLICSDGVWEFISSEEAINLIYEFGYDNVMAVMCVCASVRLYACTYVRMLSRFSLPTRLYSCGC